MSCVVILSEPCIRGHRSTKCTHATERLMVPVRKPGRPLSSCPHPASRPCSCAAVTAAIPKKQKCGCGTSASAPEDDKVKNNSGVGATPPSPSKATPPPTYRIQKPASKGVNGRKQSIDPAGLERMDSSQFNVLPQFEGVRAKSIPTPDGIASPLPNTSAYGALNFVPPSASFAAESTLLPLFQHAIPHPDAKGRVLSAPVNEYQASQTNGFMRTSPTSTPGSCCGSKKTANVQPITPQTASINSKTNGIKEVTTKGCCSSASDNPQDKLLADLMPPPNVQAQPNGIMIPPFQTPMMMPNGMFPYFPQPSVFSYPPQYGSYLQPLQPEQWRQVMAALNFGQQIPTTYGMPAPTPLSVPDASNMASWTSHQCNCGDTCQCVGCATHPYNDATQTYVRSAWNTMAEDAQKQQRHATDGASMSNGDQNDTHEAPSSILSNGMTNHHPDGTVSPPAPQTPSDAASGISEEQTLSASDFFFVSYPFGDSCAGDTSTCQCGDDCQCIGCVIHGNNDTAAIEQTEDQESL